MAESDLERRNRIINHMNKDHIQELTYYLRHFCNLSSSATKNPQVVNITFKELIIRTQDGKSHTVSFTPPLQSWDEIRPRVVAMDEAARKNLGVSDVRITEHRWPDKPIDYFFFYGVAFYWLCWSTKSLVQPGTASWELIASVLGEKGPPGYLWLVRTLAIPVAGIHLVEAVAFHFLRMRKYQVETGSLLWWKWIFCVWMEGVSSWQRVQRVADDAKNKKSAKAH